MEKHNLRQISEDEFLSEVSLDNPVTLYDRIMKAIDENYDPNWPGIRDRCDDATLAVMAIINKEFGIRQ